MQTALKEYKKDIGLREARCHNVALAIVRNSEKLTGNIENKWTTKRKIRDFILRETDQTPEDKLGDNRAHGDACGGHGLKLDMIGEGADAQIYFTKKNINICKAYLKKEEEESGEVELS